ncbi:MAG: HD domain-containing phosphohydrolase [Pseudomonadota bacterium]
MNRSVSIFRSKVARRIFILFICCALFPLCVMALLAFSQVSTQLKEQSVEQLSKSAKAHGVSIYERLLFIENDLQLIGMSVFERTDGEKSTQLSETLNQTLLRRLKAVALIRSSGDMTPIHGDIAFSPEALLQNASRGDKNVLRFSYEPLSEFPARVFMLVHSAAGKATPDWLVGEIDPLYLWGIGHENILPPMTDLCILDPYRKVLVSSFAVSSDLLLRVSAGEATETSRWFEYSQDKDSYIATYWPLFLKSNFISDNLIVVLRRAKSDVLAPLAQFKKIFPFVVLLTLWVVLLLSLIYIRKSLIPLEKLKDGTLRVAERHFDTRIGITTGDEFEELSRSFDWMTSQLDKHFHALTARSEIDRAVLSAVRTKKIIETSLKKISGFFQCNAIGMGLFRSKQPDSVHTYGYTFGDEEKFIEDYLRIVKNEEEMLSKTIEHLQVDLRTSRPSYVSPAIAEGMRAGLVLPLFVHHALIGFIVICHVDEKAYEQDDLNHARQLANQVAIALSNAYLIEDLESLNWGTLEALARTVDAKSQWTAGHSERVAMLSVKIAQVMGCGQKEIDLIQRAGFLHDIGKIGIPVSILDKPSALTPEEYEIVKQHSAIGAKILEPIEAYAEVIPIVLQHHEKYGGKGYPNGLSGDGIVLGARILAVADVFDAVASDRPYRQGWIEEKAINLITENAGKDFDPLVVEAFLSTRIT